ncbi:MAG: protoporphyrinogen oxidase [Planctomycetaceae bacterium]
MGGGDDLQSAIPNPQFRVAVIGGGITGLAAAHRLIELSADRQRPLELTLFETGPRVGGVIGTQRRDGYLIETGADSFITNQPWAVDLCQRLDLENELIPTDETLRRSLVLRNGKPVPAPDGFMLLSPAKLWPVLTSPIFSLWGKLRMGCEYVVPRRSETGDVSLASFVRRRFGREALERLVQPLVGGIYTSDPEKLSLRATMPRFLDMEREHRSLIRASRKQAAETDPLETSGSGARYGLFTTLENGLQQLIDALRERIEDAATIRLNTPVTGITRGNEWCLDFADGSGAEFDAVIVTTRAYQAGDLLRSLDGTLAAQLRGIEYASSAIAITGHRLSDVRDSLDAFGLVIPAIERRKIIAVSFTSRKFPGRAPGGRVLLRTFAGGAMQPELMQLVDAELIDVVRRELRDILGVDGEPDFLELHRYENAMPQYHVGHLERVDEIERLVSSHRGLEIAGNAFRGVGIPDCVHSGEQAAERLVDADQAGSRR